MVELLRATQLDMTEIRIVTDSPLPAERVLAAGPTSRYDVPRSSRRSGSTISRFTTLATTGPTSPKARQPESGSTGALPLRLVATRLGQGDRHQLQRLRRTGQQLGAARDAHGRRQPGGDDLATRVHVEHARPRLRDALPAHRQTHLPPVRARDTREPSPTRAARANAIETPPNLRGIDSP